MCSPGVSPLRVRCAHLLVAAILCTACGGSGTDAITLPSDSDGSTDGANEDAAITSDASPGAPSLDATVDASTPATDGAPADAADGSTDATGPDGTSSVDAGTGDAADATGAVIDAPGDAPAPFDDAPAPIEDATSDAVSPPPPHDASVPDAALDAGNPDCPNPDAASPTDPFALIEVGNGSTLGYFAVDVGGACRHFLAGAYEVSISPDHKHVAYRTAGAPNGALYVVSVANLDAPVLVDQDVGGATFFVLGAWAPDSSHFLYERDTPGDASTSPWTVTLSVATADGSSAHALPPSGSGYVWSPDGTQLAATCVGPSFNTALGTCVAFACPSSDCARTSATIADGVEGIVWGPDSNHLAVISAGLTGRPQLYVVDATSGTPTKITSVTDGQVGNPTWSPSGSQILYLRSLGTLATGGFLGDVWVACADGSCSDSLSASLPGAAINAGYAGGITWSATGARVAFTAQQTYAALPHVFTACPGGSCATTDLGAIASDSAGYLWSSTGAHVYLPVAGNAPSATLIAACPDGSCAVTLGPADNGSLRVANEGYAFPPARSAFAYTGSFTLYAVAGELGSSVAISQSGETVGDDYAFTPDGTMVAYATTNLAPIITACIDGSCRKVTSPSPPAGWTTQDVAGTLAPSGM